MTSLTRLGLDVDTLNPSHVILCLKDIDFYQSMPMSIHPTIYLLYTMITPETVIKRIHVGGLTPSITPAHIKDRFKSFGNVLDVEDLKADALGMYDKKKDQILS